MLFFLFKTNQTTLIRQLQCDRVTVHKHLFTSYILTGLAWIAYYNAVAINPEVLLDNPVWCRLLHILTQYFTASNYFWMLCEGLFLHTLIVFTFVSVKKLLAACCILGWLFPLALTIMYGLSRQISTKDESLKK